MKTVKTTIAIVGMLLLAVQVQATTRVVRATEMGAIWSDLSKGKLADTIVEFRQGDELPMHLSVGGDLMEVKPPQAINYIGIKKNFWLRINKNVFEISLDGTNFKKHSDVIKGSIEARATSSSGGAIDAINVIFNAFLK